MSGDAGQRERDETEIVEESVTREKATKRNCLCIIRTYIDIYKYIHPYAYISIDNRAATLLAKRQSFGLSIMPHANNSGGGGDDLGSEDEVKVFKDEGEDERTERSSENLTEEKSSLIDLTESEVPIYNKQNLCHHLSLSLSLCHSSIQKSMCVSCVLQEKGSLAGGSYATTTGKTSARSDLSPVFGEFLSCLLDFVFLVYSKEKVPLHCQNYATKEFQDQILVKKFISDYFFIFQNVFLEI